MDRKLFNLVFVGTMLVMIIFFAAWKGLLYLVGYLIVVALILKLAKSEKIKLVLLLILILMMIFGMYVMPII
ncbi:hypothetical protein EBB07_17185 [Paenibacillaceae bacterium]|nr:hypothetical protein EBB07_17185 [Paenibacillaceae bacterium]